ncbi:MAG TPA: hypothetical protein VGD16_02895 [Enterovirga sp.]|jgi:hypothetical protein
MQNSRMKTVSALAIGLLLGATTMLPGAAAAQEGGYYGSYDRHGWRGETTDGYGRDRLDRGYRMGRDDDRRYDRYSRDRDSDRDQDRTSPGGTGSRQGALDRLLAEHAETQTALQQARPLLQEARAAVQQNDKGRAEQALTRAEALLFPSPDSRKQVERSLDDLEQALRRDDRDAADQALRRAREAIQQSSAAAQANSAGNTPSGSNTSGSTTSGATSGGSASSSGGGTGTGTSRP